MPPSAARSDARCGRLRIGRRVLTHADRRGFRAVGAARGCVNRRRRRSRRLVRQRAPARRPRSRRRCHSTYWIAGCGSPCFAVGVRTVAFGGLLELREVDIRAHLRMRVAGAEQRREDGVDASLRVALDLLHIFELRRVQPVRRALLREEVAVLVDDRHVLHGHIRHAGRHHVLDRDDLALVQRAAGVEIQHDRRGRQFLFPHEHGWAFGMARWTRASRTEEIDAMVFSSSPSSAR